MLLFCNSVINALTYFSLLDFHGEAAMKSEVDINEELLVRLSQLSENRESGQLIFRNDNVKGFIVFYQGKIAWAVSNKQAETLGELMLRTGRVSEHHFKEAKKLFEDSKGTKKFGQILNDIAGFDRSSLKSCLLIHTRSALETLLINDKISIDFKPCFIVDDNDITLSITEIFEQNSMIFDIQNTYLT